MTPVVALVALWGCTDINDDELLLPADTAGETWLDPLPAADDRLVILNGKLSSKDANYTLNETGADGHWLGSSLHLYDPSAPGVIEHLGILDYGPDDEDFDLESMVVREVAADGDGELWGVFIDQGTNDEWILGHIEVPDLDARGQSLPTTLYVVNPSDADVYEVMEYAGAGFTADGALVLGSEALSLFPGAIFELAMPPVFEDPKDAYYAEPGLGSLVAELPDDLGIAGDITELDGRRLALVHSGTDFTVCWLFDLDAMERIGDGVERPADEPLTGLSVVGDTLIAVGIEGDVMVVDPDTGEFAPYDDLGPAYPDDDLGQPTIRLRGTATVTLP